MLPKSPFAMAANQLIKAEREVCQHLAPLTNSRSGGTAHGSYCSIPKSVLAQAAPALGLACDPAWQRPSPTFRLRFDGRCIMKAAILGLALGLLAALFLGNIKAHARDLGQWENNDPIVKKW